MSFPDLCGILNTWYGPGVNCSGLEYLFSDGANLPTGTNLPYTLTDFAGFYPKFLGAPSVLASAGAALATTITVTGDAGLGAGELVIGPGIAAGTTTVSSLSVTPATIPPTATVTLSLPTTSAVAGALNFYESPLVPLSLLTAYILEATINLSQSRFGSGQWPRAVALYVAHFATLYLQSEGLPGSPAGSAALSGLAQGIVTSESAGGVSYSAQMISGLDDWAAWTMTTYGLQFATMAKASAGFGMIQVW